MRFLRRIALAFVALPALLFTLEAGYFVWALNGETEIREADVIVAFEGRNDRAKAAYDLVDRSCAPNLVISPATEKTLKYYEKKYNPSRPFARIVEDKSRSTFENALYTRKILEENGFQSTIVVTSWDHTPRSTFLLRLLCLGHGVSIRSHQVATGRLDSSNWYRNSMGWKMVYNEMVEFWGSLVEFAKFSVNGELPAEAPGKSSLARRLKQVLLFEIDPKAL